MIGLVIFRFIFHFDLRVAPERMCQNLNEIYEASVKAIISTISWCRVFVVYDGYGESSWVSFVFECLV